MSTATQAAPAAPIDLASLREVRRTWNESKQLTWVEAEYEGHETYQVAGWSDGTGAVCCEACKGWRFNQRCKHASAWPIFVEELERRYQATKSTADLMACLDFWIRQREPLNADQRLAQAAQRAVLHARGVKHTDAIPLAARLGIVARGKRAAAELEGN